jgi:hypothetical protein
MIKPSQKYKSLSIVLLFVLLTQACTQVKLDAPPALPTAQDIGPLPTEEQVKLLPTQTATVEIPVPTKTEIHATATAFPKVTLNVVKGNLFIRRGPDMAFNPIDVLYKNTSAEVIARDVLSKWVQIKIPNSDKTGWVSLQTKYSQIEGEIKDLPEFTPTDWPIAAYLRNCTYHQIYVLPIEVVIPPFLSFPDNEVWIYPGTYTVRDIDVSGDPEIAKIVIKEGSVIEIRDDGLGGHHKCP